MEETLSLWTRLLLPIKPDTSQLQHDRAEELGPGARWGIGDRNIKSYSRMPKRYISHIWGDTPNNPIVNKFCMWVPLSDVISYDRFYLYHFNTT